jgi:hypothetical protein
MLNRADVANDVVNNDVGLTATFTARNGPNRIRKELDAASIPVEQCPRGGTLWRRA